MNRLTQWLREHRRQIAGAVPLLLIALYAYGVLLRSVQLRVQSVSIPGTAGAVWDWNPFRALATVFSPFGLGVTAALCALAFLFSPQCREWLGGGKIVQDERGFEILSDGVHGTSGWMEPAARRKILMINDAAHLKGMPLGKLDEGTKHFVAVRETAYLSGHVIAYGASGSGKTRGLTLPLIVKKIEAGPQAKESLVIIDPKGDLFEKTSQYARDRGFVVRALNLLDLDHSDGFNCFADVENDASLVSIIAETIIATTSNKLEKSDFWSKAEKNLLMALILYVSSQKEPGTGKLRSISERSLGVIYDMLSTQSILEIDSRFAQLPADHPAQKPYGIFKQANHTIWGNIAIGLGNRLSVYQDPLVDKITRYNDIDLTRPGFEPCVYYVIISDHDNTMEFLSSLFFSIMFIRLMAMARREGDGGRFPVRVNMILEEFCNIYIAGASRLMSVVRSRNIACVLLVQSIAQLSGRYPQKEWEEIISNCSVQLVLGVNDVMTAEYCSKKCGMVTVRSRSTVSPQTPGFSPMYGAANLRYSKTESSVQRPLMMPDEISQMPRTRCLALISGQKPLMLYKLTPEELPGYASLKTTRIVDYTPAWVEREKTKPPHAAVPARTPPVKTNVPDVRYVLPAQAAPVPEPPVTVGRLRRYTPEEVMRQTEPTHESAVSKKDEEIT